MCMCEYASVWMYVGMYMYVHSACLHMLQQSQFQLNTMQNLELCSTGTGTQTDSQSMAPGSEQLRLPFKSVFFAQAIGQIMSGGPFQPVLCYESVWECVLTYVYAFAWH